MFFDLIRKRRSIRRFTQQPLSSEQLLHLQEAALRSPSSRNLDPWEFIFVTDAALLQKLSEAKEHGSHFLCEAPLGIVVLANPALSDVWIEDTSISSTFLFLAAEALDLGACWIQIRNRKTKTGESSSTYIKNLLQIPSSLEVLSIIAIGHKAEKRKPLADKDLKRAKLFFNTYQQNKEL